MIPIESIGILLAMITITHGLPIPSKPVLEYGREYEGTLTITYGSKKRSTDELDEDTVHLQLTVLNSDHKIKLRKTRDSIFSNNFKFHIESGDDNVRHVRDVTPSQSDINSLESNHYVSDEENAVFSINNETGKVSGHMRDMAVDTVSENGTQKVVVTKPKNPEHGSQGYKDYIILPGYKPLPPLIEGRSAKNESKKLPHGKVEIYVVWDFRLYTYFKGNQSAILEYTALYFRCYNFYYATLKESKIRYIVTGLTALGSMEAQKEIIGEKKIKADCEPPKYNIFTAMAGINTWTYKRKKKLPPFDLAMFITSLDLQWTIYESSPCGWDSLAGMANSGTVCDYANVGVGEGGKGFDGVGTIVHEAAHILGAEDGGQGIMGNDVRFDWQGWFDAKAEKALKNAVLRKGCLRKINAPNPVIPEYKRNSIKHKPHTTLLQVCKKYLAGYWNPQIQSGRTPDQSCTELRCQYYHVYIQYVNFGKADDGLICNNRGGVCKNGKCEDRLDHLFIRHKHGESQEDNW